MNSNFLLREIEIKSKLIQVLNELIIEQHEQLDYYRKMINEINSMINNNAYIEI